MITRYMSDETEHSHSQGQPSQTLHKLEITIIKVTHSGTKQTKSISWDYCTKCSQHVPGMPLFSKAPSFSDSWPWTQFRHQDGWQDPYRQWLKEMLHYFLQKIERRPWPEWICRLLKIFMLAQRKQINCMPCLIWLVRTRLNIL